MQKLDQLFSNKKTAERLNVSPRTLNNARSSGTGIIINFVKIGSRVFYKQSDIEAYIEKNTFTHTGECKASV